jgi:ferredoxin-NADP reductase/CRP-like cAMP-binding protein
MALDRSAIKSNPFFRLLKEDDFSNLLNHVSIVSLQPKEVLFREGDFSDAFYIVKSGAIQISTVNLQGATIFLARIIAGGFFGEQAFSPAFSPRRRAKAVAQYETLLYRFPREILLSLNSSGRKLQTILHEKNSQYLKDKLQKLADSFQQSSYPIANLMKKDDFYPERTNIFYQNDRANSTYILISGEVELRVYDEDKKIQQMVDLGPGQMFGIEGLKENASYAATAVAKLDSHVAIIDSNQYHEVCKNYPWLKNLGDCFNSQFTYKAKGKITQFHSEFLEMAATTSIISLKNSREVICQQVAGENIFLASISGARKTREIKYIKDEHYHRSLSLENKKIVALLEYGIWTDSDRLLDLIIGEYEISENQIAEFIESGHISFDDIEASDNTVICKCMRVTQREINSLIIAKKADYDEISRLTGAGTICGGCKPLILEMLGANVWSACAISKVIDHTPEVKSFQLTPLNDEILLYKPGQYIVVKAKIEDIWIRRNYTLTSIPGQPYYEITVKKEPHGIFSTYLFENKDDNQVFYVAGPYGEFTLEQAQQKPVLCFMGGIGITPAVAFVRQLMNTRQSQKIFIDYSAMHAEQFILMDEFARIEKAHSTIAINHRITNVCGNLTEQEVKNIISSIENCHIYVCGPQAFENLIIETTEKMKIPPERLHVEQFIHAGVPENIAPSITL